MVIFLRDQHERSYILTSIFILLCVTITLCLVFVPKVLEVAKDPRSRAKPQRAMVPTTTTTTTTKRKSTVNHTFNDKQLKIARIKDLTKQNEFRILRTNATKVYQSKKRKRI